MKSNTALIGMALLFLAMTVSLSIILWSDISAPVKVAMFAGGFTVGVPVGAILARRRLG